MVTPNTTLCPSARAEEGALLLGVVGKDRAVRMLSEPEPLTPELTEAVLAVDEPEKHFRFANRCVKSGCNQWHGGRCGVIDLVMSFNQHLTEPIQAEPVQAEPTPLPACGIRSQCRWHQQIGSSACIVCPFIVTDATHTSEERLIYIHSHALQ